MLVNVSKVVILVATRRKSKYANAIYAWEIISWATSHKTHF